MLYGSVCGSRSASLNREGPMKSPQDTIRFTEEDVAETLKRLRKLADQKFGPAAGRRDFYAYLAAVYRWVIAWKNGSKLEKLRKLVAKQAGLEALRANADVFHLVIAETCSRPKTTKSKFAIALSNAAKVNVPAEGFQMFLEDIGGPTTLCIRLSTLGIRAVIREARTSHRRGVRVVPRKTLSAVKPD